MYVMCLRCAFVRCYIFVAIRCLTTVRTYGISDDVIVRIIGIFIDILKLLFAIFSSLCVHVIVLSVGLPVCSIKSVAHLILSQDI